MNISIKNHLFLFGFCLLLGAAAGLIVWLFMSLVSFGTTLIWEILPAHITFSGLPVLVCALLGLLSGLIRLRSGDYPEELSVILTKIKKEHHYDYRPMLAILSTSLIALILGSSVGPEAALTGIVTGLCYWIGDNLRFARQNTLAYSEIGTAVTLGVLFHSPLFGIFEVFENDQPQQPMTLPPLSRILLYGLSLASGTGIYMLLSAVLGQSFSGFPSFSLDLAPDRVDYLMLIPYCCAGLLLAAAFSVSNRFCKHVLTCIPPVLREGLTGLCIGIVALFAPLLLFSGEEAMGELPETFGLYLPVIWIAIAFAKVFFTSFCIEGGLKGGHFFPIIFAGVALGYGISGLFFTGDTHQIFAAAIVTASLLGASMRKPFAVTLLLLLCFPVRLCVWIFLAAAVASFICQKSEKYFSEKHSARALSDQNT